MAQKKNLGDGGSLEFHYQKSSGYRTLHADGFWGGSTPRGLLAVSFFSERIPIPKTARRTIISQDGDQFVAGAEEVVVSLDGIVRQIESTVMMDLRTAQEFFVFLNEHVAQMERAMGVPESERVARPQSGEPK